MRPGFERADVVHPPVDVGDWVLRPPQRREEVSIGVGKREAAVCNVQVLLYRFIAAPLSNTSRQPIVHFKFYGYQSAPAGENNRPRVRARIVHGAPTAEHGSANPCEGG